MSRLRGLFILDRDALEMVYGPAERTAIAKHVEMVAPPQTQQSIESHPELLANVDVIFSGWGCPVVNEAFLSAAPNLGAIFYGAGAVGQWMTPAVAERNIVVTTASTANAIPVAEYTLATILFSLKHGWSLARQTSVERRFPARDGAPGCYGSTVGLVAMGLIARALVRMLKAFDLRVITYDPFLTAAEAAQLGVERAILSELFQQSDVVSIHAPALAETNGMITGELIASMRNGATLINTARGSVVNEAQMIEVLSARPDLQAVLDVTDPIEPPAVDSPLYTLPNVVLTPHIAGSVGKECRRMGQYMVDELERYVAGQPLRWALTPDMTKHSCHRPQMRLVAADRSARPAAVAVGG